MSKFILELCSDLDFEEMVLDVSYDNSPLAMITQEKGLDKIEIEIFDPPNGKSWMFKLDDFEKMLQMAKNELINSQKLPD